MLTCPQSSGPAPGVLPNRLIIHHMKTYNNTRGFSLIELLVALSILAVVAAVIVPRFLNVRVQAAQTATQSQQRTIQRAIQQFVSLGGQLGTAGSAEVLTFLATPATGVGVERTPSTNGVRDSAGNFGSTSISLSLGNVATLADGRATGYNLSGTAVGGSTAGRAVYSDGAGTVWQIEIVPQPGTARFIATTIKEASIAANATIE